MTKKNPKVSIIVCAYKVSDFLPQCIESLIAQTLKDIEIICINDASPDNCSDIIEKYALIDKRIKNIKNPKNYGISRSRNIGIKESTAPFIMFCDGDDFYNQDMCEKLYKSITEENTDIAMCGINIIYQTCANMKRSDENYYMIKYSGKHLVSNRIISSIDYSPVNKIYKKSIIDKYNITFPDGLHYEDACFNMKYLSVCNSISFQNSKLYNYIRRPNSIMTQTWAKKGKDFSVDHIYIMIEYFYFLKHNKILLQYNSLFWNLFSVYENSAINNSKGIKAKINSWKTAKKFMEKNIDSLQKVDEKLQKSIKKQNAPTFLIRSSFYKFCDFWIRVACPLYKLQCWSGASIENLDVNIKDLERRIEKMRNSSFK